MSSMFNAYKLAATLVTGGTYMDMGDFRIKIAFAGEANPRYTKQISDMHKVKGRAIFSGTMSEDEQRKLFIEIYAKCIVLDWEVKDGDNVDDDLNWKQGIPAEDGSLLPFTADNIIITLLALPMLFREIKSHAENTAYYRAALLADIIKN